MSSKRVSTVYSSSKHLGETNTMFSEFIRKLTNLSAAADTQTLGGTSAMSEANLAYGSRINAKNNELIKKFVDKATSILKELENLPAEELAELNRTEGFNVQSIMRSLLLSSDNLEQNEADMDAKLEEIRRFIARIRPKLVGNVNKKQKIMTQLTKQAIKTKMLRDEIKRFADKIDKSRTFNDGIFSTVVNFERNIAMPYLDVSFVNSILSAYYVYTASPRVVELQQRLSQLFVVYSQTELLGNNLVVPYIPNQRVPNKHTRDIKELGSRIYLLETEINPLRTNEFHLLMNSAPIFYRNDLNWSPASLEVLSIPYRLNPRFFVTHANFYQTIKTATNPVRLFENNVLTQSGKDGGWPNFIRLTQYADEKTLQRAAFTKKTSQERVVSVLSSYANEIIKTYSSILASIREQYRQKSPAAIRDILHYNSTNPAGLKINLNQGALIVYINALVRDSNPQNSLAEKLYNEVAGSNSTRLLDELDLDSQNVNNNLNQTRIVIGIFSNIISALEFIPILMEYFVPLRLLSTRSNSATKALALLPQFQALRNAVIKAFWIYVNKNGVETLYTLLDLLARELVNLRQDVVMSSFMFTSLADSTHMVSADLDITAIKKSCEQIIVIFLTGKPGLMDTAIKSLNPVAHDYSVEEAEQSLGLENTSDYNVDIY